MSRRAVVGGASAGSSGAVGVWIRMRHHFGARLSEWLLAYVTFAWGVVALLPGPLFEQPTYLTFKLFFGSENWLGLLMLVLGGARLGGLVVNGARQRITSWMRVVSADIGVFIWVGMVTAHAMSGVVGIWLAFYPAFAIAELVNAHRAAHDAGESNGLP